MCCPYQPLPSSRPADHQLPPTTWSTFGGLAIVHLGPSGASGKRSGSPFLSQPIPYVFMTGPSRFHPWEVLVAEVAWAPRMLREKLEVWTQRVFRHIVGVVRQDANCNGLGPELIGGLEGLYGPLPVLRRGNCLMTEVVTLSECEKELPWAERGVDRCKVGPANAASSRK
ncbi:uncharacterized protein L203_102711 [Cryptococcus depauperatus CBS 7841]|uniref:Uncharacterized protein n=1 Tax=Cryptococcus depauperatus CBS 7841 TaxID=1295531 RepID=A0AAJ8JS92_9TREE